MIFLTCNRRHCHGRSEPCSHILSVNCRQVDVRHFGQELLKATARGENDQLLLDQTAFDSGYTTPSLGPHAVELMVDINIHGPAVEASDGTTVAGVTAAQQLSAARAASAYAKPFDLTEASKERAANTRLVWADAKREVLSSVSKYAEGDPERLRQWLVFTAEMVGDWQANDHERLVRNGGGIDVVAERGVGLMQTNYAVRGDKSWGKQRAGRKKRAAKKPIAGGPKKTVHQAFASDADAGTVSWRLLYCVVKHCAIRTIYIYIVPMAHTYLCCWHNPIHCLTPYAHACTTMIMLSGSLAGGRISFRRVVGGGRDMSGSESTDDDDDDGSNDDGGGNGNGGLGTSYNLAIEDDEDEDGEPDANISNESEASAARASAGASDSAFHSDSATFDMSRAHLQKMSPVKVLPKQHGLRASARGISMSRLGSAARATLAHTKTLAANLVLDNMKRKRTNKKLAARLRLQAASNVM